MVADRVFVGERVLTPEGVRPAAVLVRGEKIVGVVAVDQVPPDVAVVRVAGVLVPGLVDTHVHINDPGRSHWEGFVTATRAAAAGGVTTLVDMPLNAIPPTTTLAGFLAKQRAAFDVIWVDVGLCGGLVPDNLAELGPLRDAGVFAFKSFLSPSGVAEFPHIRGPALARGLRELSAMDVPLLVHAEVESALVDPPLQADPRQYATWLTSRPEAVETEAINTLFELCRAHGAHAHVVHLSAASALPLVARAHAEDVRLTVETCPHYLTFVAEDIADGATAFKCAPPIRGRANRDALWRGLADGLISQIVTDHSPADPAVKCVDTGDFMQAWGGISSLQIGLSAVWTEASRRGVSFADVVTWMATNTAAMVGLSASKGRIAVGMDADLVDWDPDALFVVEPERLFHQHPITPYAGRALRGRVSATYLRGALVYRDGQFASHASGKLLRAGDT